MVTHLFSHASNHQPIILHARTALRCRGKSTRSFRFEEAWLMRDDCEHVIQEAWSYSSDNVESGLRREREKIRNLVMNCRLGGLLILIRMRQKSREYKKGWRILAWRIVLWRIRLRFW